MRLANAAARHEFPCQAGPTGRQHPGKRADPWEGMSRRDRLYRDQSEGLK